MDDFDWDFSGDDSTDIYWGSRRRGSGCFLIAVGLFFALVLAFSALVWMLQHKRQIEIVVFFAFVGAGGWFARGYVAPLFARRSRPDASAAPMLLAQAKPGPVHTTGLVGVSAAPLHAPLGAPPCAFFRIVVDSPNHPGRVLFEARSADELVLDDGGGNKLVVHLDGAKWLVQRCHEMS